MIDLILHTFYQILSRRNIGFFSSSASCKTIYNFKRIEITNRNTFSMKSLSEDDLELVTVSFCKEKLFVVVQRGRTKQAVIFKRHRG